MSNSEGDKLNLVLTNLQRLQEDLQLAKCQIKTAVRDVVRHQEVLNDSLIRLHVVFRDLDERLHGIEMKQDRDC